MAENCSLSELTERIRKFGFTGPHDGSKHQYMLSPDGRKIILNCRHGARKRRNDVHAAVVSIILRAAHISKEQWDLAGDPNVKSLPRQDTHTGQEPASLVAEAPDVRKRRVRQRSN